MYKRSEHQYPRHIHMHTEWISCLLGDKCVAGMVIRKKINTHTQWTSVSLCLILSVSAAQLIHLQLSRLVKQVRGNVVLCQGLNPQSSPGYLQRVRSMVQGDPCRCLFLLLCETCVSSGKQVDAPAPGSTPSSSDPTWLPAEGRPPVFAVSLRPYGPSYTLKIGFKTQPCVLEITLHCYEFVLPNMFCEDTFCLV